MYSIGGTRIYARIGELSDTGDLHLQQVFLDHGRVVLAFAVSRLQALCFGIGRFSSEA
jgi:hypothetical protein